MKKIIITAFLLGLGSSAYAEGENLDELFDMDYAKDHQQKVVSETLSTPPAVGDRTESGELNIFFDGNS